MTESQKAFEAWATDRGYDTAHTYDTERSRWVWLNPMTADRWESWTASREAALEEAEKAVENEALEEPHGREDAAYNLGIEDGVAAIRSLRDAGKGKDLKT